MKRGISLISLLTASVIMIILATTITVSGVNVSNNAKKIRFANEILYIKESVESYKQKNSDLLPIASSIIIDLKNVNSNDLYQFGNEDIEAQKLLLYKIDKSLLGNIELVYGNEVEENDVYAISKETGNVYYIKGFKVGKTTYYTLTDDLKKTINYVESNKDNIASDGIIFNDSITEWTNKNVVTKVIVPKEYSSVSTTVTKAGSTSTSSGVVDTNTGDVVYTVDISGNYAVSVSYKKADGNSYSQLHTVSNYDNTSPILTCSKSIISSDDGSINLIKIDSKSDDLSGIKYLKYENESISSTNAKSYFSSNGMNVQNDIISVENGVKQITLYIEDNAGNYNIISYSI